MAERNHSQIENLDSIIGATEAAQTAIVCTPISKVRGAHEADGNPIRTTRHIVIVPTHGSGIHEVDGSSHLVEPGAVVHVQPGQVHRWLRDEDFTGWVLAIGAHVCPPGLFDLTSPTAVVRLGPSIDVAHALVSSLTEPDLLPARAQERLRISIAAVLLELIASASEGPHVPAELAGEYALVADFRRELEFHYLETRSVADYAALVGCSTKTLTRATKRLLGQTPKQIIDARVTYAASRLLANTDVSISWISSKLGFSQQSNFAKFFNRQVGLTPNAYRESCATSRTSSVTPPSIG